MLRKKSEGTLIETSNETVTVSVSFQVGTSTSAGLNSTVAKTLEGDFLERSKVQEIGSGKVISEHQKELQVEPSVEEVLASDNGRSRIDALTIVQTRLFQHFESQQRAPNTALAFDSLLNYPPYPKH